jgi:exonuclease III
MRFLFWNIRGFRWAGRQTQLRDYLRSHQIDDVCLQETIKQAFTDQELRGLEVGERFFWSWLPTNGHSRGVLIGFRDSVFEVGTVEIGSFFVSASVLRRADKMKLEIMGIYGPADHASSGRFLEEISSKVARSRFPMIMGGDFNLMRIPEDKKNDRINWPRLDLFNEHIANWAVQEIPRTGARFTWSNRQLNPVRCVLNRVFISIDLEPSFRSAPWWQTLVWDQTIRCLCLILGSLARLKVTASSLNLNGLKGKASRTH